MDKNTIAKAAAAGIAPRILKKVGMRWAFAGVAAYYGLKYLNKKGILPKQTGAALDMIDQGIHKAQEVFGFESSPAPKAPNSKKRAATKV